MKKVILALFVTILFSSASKAQEVGEIWLGGQVGYSTSQHGDDDRVRNFKILPEAGYQISKKWGVGVALGYVYSEDPSDVTAISDSFLGEGKINYFKFSPFARYTVLSILRQQQVALFIDGGIDYTHGKEDNSSTTINGYGVGLRPGIKVNFTDNFAFVSKVGFLGYEHSQIKQSNFKQNKDSFRFGADLDQITIGLHYSF